MVLQVDIVGRLVQISVIYILLEIKLDYILINADQEIDLLPFGLPEVIPSEPIVLSDQSDCMVFKKATYFRRLIKTPILAD